MADKMAKELTGNGRLDITSFMEELVSSEPLDVAPCVYDAVYEAVRDSLRNGLARETKKRLSAFYEKEELLAELLDLSDRNALAASRQYYFGQMKAITDLLSDAAVQEEELQEIRELSARFSYLPRCLELVDASEPISGQCLRKRLELSKDGFSYFVSQVRPYRLFDIRKHGKQNYYSLTLRGRRVLRQNVIAGKLDDGQRVCSEQFLVFLLESIREECKSGGQNAGRVLLKANLKCGGSGLQGETPELYDSLEGLLDAVRPSSAKPPKAAWVTEVRRQLKALESPQEPDDVYRSDFHVAFQTSGGLKYGGS